MSRPVALVVISYGSGAHLQEQMRALSPMWDLVDHAVFWENHPRAPLPSILSPFPRVTVYRSPWNLGFAAAVNRAVRLLPRAVPYLWLLNPDAWPREPDFLARALERIGEDPRVAVFTPRVVYPDGTPQPVVKHQAGLREALFARTGVLGFLAGYRPSQPEEAGPVPFAAAVSWLVRRDVFQRLGGLDERYFLFYEDTDFCRKVREAGFIIWYEPSLTVVHRQGHARRDRVFWSQLHKIRSGLRFVSRDMPVPPWLQIGGIGLAGLYGLMHLFGGTWMKEVQHWNTLKKPSNRQWPSVRG